MSHTLELHTSAREALVDITAQVRAIVKQAGVKDGLCVVYVPHTTAGVTINEAADPDVAHDILLALAQAVPRLAGFRHDEGNSTAHVKSTLTGASATVLVHGGELVLGTWQGIFFCEYDGPRRRQVLVHVQ